jgi:hypothetical protein
VHKENHRLFLLEQFLLRVNITKISSPTSLGDCD